MPIQWRDAMSVDGGVIDQDHHVLINIINKFEAQAETFKSREDALGLLKALRKYAHMHFKREEELQRIAGYEFREAHHNEHVHLIKVLDQLVAETDAVAGEGDYLKELAIRTAGLLHEWLVDHVINQDLRMKPYVANMKKAQARMKPLEESAE